MKDLHQYRLLKETLYLFDEYYDMLLYDMYMYNILHAQYNFKIGASAKFEQNFIFRFIASYSTNHQE